MFTYSSFSRGLMVICLTILFQQVILAQISSRVEPDGLSILDAGTINRGADYKIGGLLVQDGFSFSQLNEQQISAGSDLVRSIMNVSGFSMKQFAVSPFKEFEANFDDITFIASNTAPYPGNDKTSLILGATAIGELSGTDPLLRGLYLDYERFAADIILSRRIFLINPDDGSVIISPEFDVTTANSSLRVNESAGNTVSIYANNNASGGSTQYGTFSRATGSGTGTRYGVVGQAFTSSGAKYGVYGSSSSSGGGYAVYASGDMAYTGSIIDVSDQRLKKDIKDFDGLATILKLRPRTYEFRRDEFAHMNLKVGKQFGFIAQELQEVLPEAVSEEMHPHISSTDTGLVSEITPYLGIQPMQLLPILTRAIQEEHEIVEEQNTRIRHLEQENQALRNRLTDLEEQMRTLQGSGAGENGPVLLSSARLDQNFPNPYDEQTAIHFFIPETVTKAELQIINAEGRLIRSIAIDARGESQQVLEARALQAGSYFYALVLDGAPVATRQMLLLK